MPIKRSSSLKRTARPRAETSVAPEPVHRDTPRILSADEKRQLILAHAAMRRSMDPIQRMSLWAGVVICMAFVIGGWMYTVGSGIKKSLAGPLDPHVQDVVDQTKEFGQDTGRDTAAELGEQLQQVTDRLKTISEQQAVLDVMVQQLSTSTAPGATSTRTNLFIPPESKKTFTTTTSTP